MALRKVKIGTFLNELYQRVWSTRIWYGFERDLSIPLVSSGPQIKLQIRELRLSDIPVLLNISDVNDDEALKDRLIRLSMVRAEIPTCYVAVTSDGVPCHMQWMISSRENKKIQRFTHGGLPVIKENEVLLENAFTLEQYRRLGIEIEVVRCLFQKAQENGVKRAFLFVKEQNLISLKLVSRLGFIPFCVKTGSWRLFQRHFNFELISKENV